MYPIVSSANVNTSIGSLSLGTESLVGGPLEVASQSLGAREA